MKYKHFERKNGDVFCQRTEPETGMDKPLDYTELLIIEMIDKIKELEDKLSEDSPVLYQCPYDRSCKCAMTSPCKGCESWHPDSA